MLNESLSNSITTLNPLILPPPHPKSQPIPKFISGFCNSPNWVTNSHKKFSPLIKTQIANTSKFNIGLCNVSKRVSWECFSSRNDGENGDYDDAYYMRKGLELARNAVGCTSPNPMVGCVIVKDGKIVGQGFHPKAGQPHAEVFALRDAGEFAENATAYVTLEPCNHYGKTPPCSEALIKAKVKKVVVGMVDPNPIVSSRGIDRLRKAGIKVVVGVEEDLCKKLNEAFIHKMLYGKPFVTLRYSISINGVISAELGDNVTECEGYYSKLLQEYDAVIHSSTSITQDISVLSSQEPNARQPLHIFIAKDRDSLSHIINLPEEGDFKAIVFADKELPLEPHISQKGIEIVVMNRISMDPILDYCGKQGFCNVLVDLRGKLDCCNEILKDGLETSSVQKVVVEVLPLWAKNEAGSSMAEMSQAQRKRLQNLSTRISGDSVVLEGYL
ncbi:hypothetical protein KSS87_010444 [Heliosperma pusillum]|nr:hypothetical protein KSS87_010444 [Heliosperma pusillum]